MSVAGPTTFPGECTGVSDACGSGTHPDCDGDVEHLPLTSEWLDPITGRPARSVWWALADHRCVCRCHLLARSERIS